MYQGLHPRTRRLRWALFGILIAIVVGSTGGQAVATVLEWLRHEYDRLPWYVTRATALLSYLALTGSVVYGLLLSTKILDRISHRTVSFTLHQDLASIGLALALVHAAVLMIDRSVPYSALEVVVPFAGPYRPLWVGIGQISLGLSLVVLLSFYGRKRMGQKSWRRLHYVSFLAFAGATVHGLMAGSDTQAAWVYLGYVVMTATVVFLTTYRIVLAVVAEPPRAVTAAGAGGKPNAGPGESSAAGSRPTVEDREPGRAERSSASQGSPSATLGRSAAAE
jgi:DMSO/TMAO reductase YedYZ heme-binding membrane subunit